MRDEASKAVRRGGSGARAGTRNSVVEPDQADLQRAVGPKDAPKIEAKLKEAAKAYQAERYGEARTVLAPLAERAPNATAVRELLGLTLYRLGRWKQAALELEAFQQMSGSTEQHPVLSDCYRALKRWDDVDRLWDELREVSPSAELVTEGRIVYAGSLADRQRLTEAVDVLAKGFKFPKHVQEHHLRRGYALADLYERAGDLPQARSMFRRIAEVEPEFGDVEDRLRALR